MKKTTLPWETLAEDMADHKVWEVAKITGVGPGSGFVVSYHVGDHAFVAFRGSDMRRKCTNDVPVYIASGDATGLQEILQATGMRAVDPEDTGDLDQVVAMIKERAHHTHNHPDDD